MEISMTAWLGWFQLVGLAIVAVICAVAVLSVVMSPPRWADRRQRSSSRCRVIRPSRQPWISHDSLFAQEYLSFCNGRDRCEAYPGSSRISWTV